MTCLDNIIGGSQTGCECLIDGLGSDELAEIQLSASGVYVDQLDGFNLEIVKSGDDCARGGLWDRMTNAIDQAKKDFQSALLQCVGQTYKPRIDPLAIQLGSPNFTGSLSLTEKFAGIEIMPLQIKGAMIFIKKIGVIVNASVPVTVKIYSNENNGTLIYTSSPINAVANVITWGVPAAPIELPMWSYYNYMRYYIVLELDGTFQPKDNRKDCGCAGVQRPYLQWMDFFGIRGNNPSEINSFANTQSINGLNLDIEIKCKATEIICSEERPLDFENDPDSMGMAYAIRFRAASRLYSEVLSSTNISRINLLDRETIAKQAQAWESNFTEWINYLCGNLETHTNGCWKCRTNNATSMSKTHIKAIQNHYHRYQHYNTN